MSQSLANVSAAAEERKRLRDAEANDIKSGFKMKKYELEEKRREARERKELRRTREAAEQRWHEFAMMPLRMSGTGQPRAPEFLLPVQGAHDGNFDFGSGDGPALQIVLALSSKLLARDASDLFATEI